MKTSSEGKQMIDCKQGNAFQLIREEKDYEFDIIMSDPPYSLGSELETKDYTTQIKKKLEKNEIDDELLSLIENNNKLDIKGTSKDFMSVWENPKGKDWEVFFKESYRILKHGGYCLLYGMEEAGALFTYYASKAGFQISQEILYIYGSSFPKNLNVSKAINKKLGNEREVLGIEEDFLKRASQRTLKAEDGWNKNSMTPEKGALIPQSTSELGQKYEGTRAGKKPLKANKETVYVFHKPLKYKTYLDDVLAYEAGEKDIHPSIWDIKNNRIGYNENDHVMKYDGYQNDNYESEYTNGTSYTHGNKVQINKSGRYPSQLLFDPVMAQRLDEQSGTLKSGKLTKEQQFNGGFSEGTNCYGNGKLELRGKNHESNEGGASRFFCTIPYLDETKENFIYSAKVNKYERNAGLEDLESVSRFGQGNYSKSPVCSICDKTENGINDHTECKKNEDYKLVYRVSEDNSVQKNSHPTVKQLNLNKKIFDLIKTCDREDEKLLIPFSGVWSEVIGAVASGFKPENIKCYELTQSYIDIGLARYKFWSENNFFFQIEDKKEFNKVKNKVESSKSKSKVKEDKTNKNENETKPKPNFITQLIIDNKGD